MSRFLAAAGTMVDRIKINAISKEVHGGRAMWIKRRRWNAAPIMACANTFFRLAGAPLQALHEVDLWQQWELACFQRLHGDRYVAFPAGRRAVAAQEVPGVNLTTYLDGGTITPQMAAAAARELQRAHACPCVELGGAWSHGDPHVGNFVYDPATNRARLIDFEVMHHRSLSSQERHADDLLVFLQDMVGRIRAELWLPCACAFLQAYGRPEIVALMSQRMVIPRGVARVWWAIRTSWLPGAEVRRRLELLRRALPAMQSAVTMN